MNIQSDYSYNYNVSMQGRLPKPVKPGDKPLDKLRKKIEQKMGKIQIKMKKTKKLALINKILNFFLLKIYLQKELIHFLM
jgi:hypothetical protein